MKHLSPHKIIWIIGSVLLFLLLGLGVSGCTTQLKWFGAGGVDCEWDALNYKGHDKQRLSPAAGGNDEFRHAAEESMRRAEEEQKQLEFGACSENDLANRTCH